MERHHTATAGSAAVDEEMVLRVDPVNAVEVDKISGSRVAGSCGSQPEEGCDKELPQVVGNNPKNEDSPPPMPHAASSCPQRERCDSESSDRLPGNHRLMDNMVGSNQAHFPHPISRRLTSKG